MSVKVRYNGVEILNANTNITKTLKTSGKYCESDIEVQNTQDGSTANVYEATFTLATHQSTNVELLTIPDNVYSHINDTNFYVNMFCTTPNTIVVNDDYTIFCCNNAEYPLQGTYPVYGTTMRKNSATTVGVNRAYYPPKETSDATGLGSSKIWHNDKKLMFKSGGYFLGAGTYKIILGW